MGVRGNPPARGFREAKTHLAPRKPANCGLVSGDRLLTPEAATAAAPGAIVAPSARGRRAESRVVGIAMTYSQGTVSGGVNNRRNGDVQRGSRAVRKPNGPAPAPPPPPPSDWCPV